MTTQRDRRHSIGTEAVRAAQSLREHCTHMKTRAARVSSAERRDYWAHWLHGRIVARGISQRTIADGYLGCDEKTVRHILTGRKALGPERLELLDEIAEDFIEEFAREAFGSSAIVVLGRVLGRLAAGEKR